MASSFKIPKKKHSSNSDTVHVQSPLSRLHSAGPENKTYGKSSNSTSFGDAVKKMLGINSPTDRGIASPANHRATGSTGHCERTSASNGWRPKRASDRLLPQQEVTSQQPGSSPPHKKKSMESSSSSIRVDAVDSLAQLRAQVHDGSERQKIGLPKPPDTQSSSDLGSEDDFVLDSNKRRSHDRRQSLGRTQSQDHSTGTDDRGEAKVDLKEEERQKWNQFRTRKNLRLTLRWTRRKQSSTEPIVLSSEEEQDNDEDDGAKRMSQRAQQAPSAEGCSMKTKAPSFLQLEFSSLHAGLTHGNANGKIMVTENAVVLPVKVSGGEEGDVTIVASQLRGYGVWDGGLARGGALLAEWEGPAPSLLFLWVTDAQANLLQKELSAMMPLTSTATAPPCCFLLLVLKEQLPELQAALLASILDMEEYQRGRCSSSSSTVSSPLCWADGLMLLHSCPPPLDQHLLSLLGHSADSGSGSASLRRGLRNKKSRLESPDLQKLPNRLIQYPPPPSKGRISVTKEDLACLDAGEFLNDVIIDFYLKFLLLEGVGGAMAERSHVFSSFFYKQLSRRRVAGEDNTPSVPDRHTRHQRVKTWTRHVDIFTKDFLFVPVNQEAHWFLVVVCFPGLEDVQYEKFQSSSISERNLGERNSGLRPQPPPECTQQGCVRNIVQKRPCILVMDSLKLSTHDNVCRLLRDYLQVEWTVRRGSSRIFTSDNMRSCSCRVPQQDNSSDCGLYLLQYAHSFLQNPVVHFDLPLRLESWFPRQQVRQKREEIRRLIVKMHLRQSATGKKNQ